MNEPTPPPRKTSLAARLWPLVVTVAIFALIFSRIPFDRFREALAGARLLPFLALMASFSLVFFSVDTLVLTKMLRWFHGPIAWRELLPVRASTYIVSIVNTQLAQGALALYLNRRFLTPLGAIAGTVAMLILCEVTQLVLFATVGILWFPGGVPAGFLAAPLALGAVWALALAAAHGRLGPRLGGNALLGTFRRARAGHVATVLVLKASVFLLSLFVHFVALGLFGIHVPLGRLLAFLPVVFMVAALPVTVAHLGTSQAAWIFFFRDYAPEANLLAYSLASHVTFMLANGTLGLVFLPQAYADLFVRRRQDDLAARGASAPDDQHERVEEEGVSGSAKR